MNNSIHHRHRTFGRNDKKTSNHQSHQRCSHLSPLRSTLRKSTFITFKPNEQRQVVDTNSVAGLTGSPSAKRRLHWTLVMLSFLFCHNQHHPPARSPGNIASTSQATARLPTQSASHQTRSTRLNRPSSFQSSNALRKLHLAPNDQRLFQRPDLALPSLCQFRFAPKHCSRPACASQAGNLNS